LATAADLDRLLHHATTVNITGDSYQAAREEDGGRVGRKPKLAGDLEELGAEA
jgi:hypothetical protein